MAAHDAAMQQPYIPLLCNSLLQGELRMVKIRGNVVKSGKANVMIERISMKGLRFISEFKFPVNPQILFSFTIRFGDVVAKLEGYIVWSKHKESGSEYEVVLTLNGSAAAQLAGLLQQLAIQYIPAYQKAEYYYHYFTESTFDFRNNRINLLV